MREGEALVVVVGVRVFVSACVGGLGWLGGVLYGWRVLGEERVGGTDCLGLGGEFEGFAGGAVDVVSGVVGALVGFRCECRVGIEKGDTHRRNCSRSARSRW